MRKTCESCGSGFDARSQKAKYCSDKCRKRAQRSAKSDDEQSNVVSFPGSLSAIAGGADSDSNRDAPRLGALTRVTVEQLERAERLHTPLGVNALLLASRLDMTTADTGSSIASLSKEYRAVMTEALKDVKAEADPLEQIRSAAALKLAGIGSG